jgi:D-serine deaminase-like pyridoxal phosphate-dependent protein
MPLLVADLETPALLVDLPRLEGNLDRYRRIAEEQGVALRPHIKTHKSVAIAERQRERGARGITTAKSTEAEAFARAGFDDIRLAYPVVGEPKWARLASLAREGARISFCVDTPAGARGASDFFHREGLAAEVLVEVDTGHGRTGVRWDHPDAAGFVALVRDLPGLRLAGLLTHGGHAYAGPAGDETPEAARRRAMAQERDRLLDLAVRAHASGALAESAELSVGSTPGASVFENSRRGPFAITEIRPGNYVFHDAQQVALGSARLAECALTVLASVISSQPDPAGGTRLYLDAGKKVLTTDLGYGVDGHGILLYDPVRMTALPHARIAALSEEHAWVTVPGASTLRVGDRVRIVPNHACVTVATADVLYVASGEEVVDEWRVDARGALR